MNEQIAKGEKVQLTDTPIDIAKKMCGGNPGALSVLMMLLTEGLDDPPRVFDLLHMDDMGMRGPAIWIGYKNWAGEDLEVFRAAIRCRNADMVATIRAEGYDVETGGKS